MMDAYPPCCHRWLVSSLPVDDMFSARCRACGAERSYPTMPDPLVMNPEERRLYRMKKRMQAERERETAVRYG